MISLNNRTLVQIFGIIKYMYFDKLNNRLKWGIVGGIIGGVIAIIGFWILSPPVNSLVLFVILRIGVGAVVAMIAMIVGPIATTRLTKNKSK